MEKTKIQHDEYIQEAENAVNIVKCNIENGTYSELTEQLNQLENMATNREKYVFEGNHTAVSGWIFLACMVFSCLFMYFTYE